MREIERLLSAWSWRATAGCEGPERFIPTSFHTRPPTELCGLEQIVSCLKPGVLHCSMGQVVARTRRHEYTNLSVAPSVIGNLCFYYRAGAMNEAESQPTLKEGTVQLGWDRGQYPQNVTC